jgi:hypothetical protein
MATQSGAPFKCWPPLGGVTSVTTCEKLGGDRGRGGAGPVARWGAVPWPATHDPRAPTGIL